MEDLLVVGGTRFRWITVDSEFGDLDDNRRAVLFNIKSIIQITKEIIVENMQDCMVTCSFGYAAHVDDKVVGGVAFGGHVTLLQSLQKSQPMVESKEFERMLFRQIMECFKDAFNTPHIREAVGDHNFCITKVIVANSSIPDTTGPIPDETITDIQAGLTELSTKFFMSRFKK